MSFSPESAARFILDAHDKREPYQNLPPDIAPASIDEAYAAQEALAKLLAPRFGDTAGLKIAVATKVMQELMGIDRPLGGIILAKRVHASPAVIRLADHIHLVLAVGLAGRLRPAPPPIAPLWAPP